MMYGRLLALASHALAEVCFAFTCNVCMVGECTFYLIVRYFLFVLLL